MTASELALTAQQRSDNLQSVMERRGKSQIGKGLTFSKTVRPGSTQVLEDESLFKSKNLVQQIEP